MYFPSKGKISKFASKGCLIPVYKEIKTSQDPSAIFSALSRGKHSFLLESARTHPKIGRYSFLGADPFIVFKSKADKIEVSRGGNVEKSSGNPFEKLRDILNKYKSAKVPGLPNFTGGAVGYFGYDSCHFFEELPRNAKDDLNLPDLYFGIYDTILAFDHFKDKTIIISNVFPGENIKKSYDNAVKKIEQLEKEILKAANTLQTPELTSGNGKKIKIESNFTRSGFEKIVTKAKQYIKQGDIYQANLSQRLSISTKADPRKLYKKLQEINPSPFSCMLDFDGLAIVSSSPERLLKLENGYVETRPIAGTRPRGKTNRMDKEFSRRLLLSPKERAEHIMLVDLERNDLGRVCEYGTVRVNEKMVLEKYSHVTHIVSNICGKLRKDKDRFDLIAAVFPGGTITGTPKIRCMEIIDELEPVARNIYTGSIGYLGFNGDMDLNIAIRTFIIKGNKAYVQVGAGIVADSDPTREYRETLHKAEALVCAIKKVASSQ